jgi:hypothetical protein
MPHVGMHLIVTAKINKQNSIFGNQVCILVLSKTIPIFITCSLILFFVSARFSLKDKAVTRPLVPERSVVPQ